MTPIQGRTG